MKKILVSCLVLFLIVGCTTTTKETEPTVTPVIQEDINLKVLAPKGAPALSLIPYVKENSEQVTFVDGTDVIQAAFVNPTPDYDVIIAPTNLGGKLAADGKTKYKMLGVITWGNLYLVSENEEAIHTDGNLAAFGEGAVPGKIFEEAVLNVVPVVTYYNSVTDAQAALLTNTANVALLAEPAATATIQKGKDSGLDLKIILDLQEAMKEKTGTYGYPQAAIFVLEDSYNQNKESFDNLIKMINSYLQEVTNDKEILAADIDEISPEELGVPNSAIVVKTWERMNISFQPAIDTEKQLTDFLKLFGIDDLTNVVID